MLPLARLLKITDRLKLDCTPEYLKIFNSHPELYHLVCNGVGSETNWTYHLTPDTIWGMDISPSAGIHDWDFTFPMEFQNYTEGMTHFHRANRRFHDNVEKQISDGCDLLKPLRQHRNNVYFHLLENSAAGHRSFWSNRLLPHDWLEFNHYTPDFNREKFRDNLIVFNHIFGDNHGKN